MSVYIKIKVEDLDRFTREMNETIERYWNTQPLDGDDLNRTFFIGKAKGVQAIKNMLPKYTMVYEDDE